MSESSSRPLRSYVFVNTEVGQSAKVAERILALDICQCRVLKVDRVIGDFDIIAQLETPDIDCLGGAITDGIQELTGVVSVAAAWCVEPAAWPEHDAPVRREQALVSVS